MHVSWNEGNDMRRIGEIVRDQNPVTLPPSATVQEASCCMRDSRSGAVLVCDASRRLLGIFTGRDAVGRVLAQGKSAADTCLSDVMTRDPHTMSPDHLA